MDDRLLLQAASHRRMRKGAVRAARITGMRHGTTWNHTEEP